MVALGLGDWRRRSGSWRGERPLCSGAALPTWPDQRGSDAWGPCAGMPPAAARMPTRTPTAHPSRQVDMRVLNTGFDEGADIVEFEHWKE